MIYYSICITCQLHLSQKKEKWNVHIQSGSTRIKHTQYSYCINWITLFFFGDINCFFFFHITFHLYKTWPWQYADMMASTAERMKMIFFVCDVQDGKKNIYICGAIFLLVLKNGIKMREVSICRLQWKDEFMVKKPSTGTLKWGEGTEPTFGWMSLKWGRVKFFFMEKLWGGTWGGSSTFWNNSLHSPEDSLFDTERHWISKIKHQRNGLWLRHKDRNTIPPYQWKSHLKCCKLNEIWWILKILLL